MELHPEKKRAGVLAPVFALRHREDLGIGDTLALRHLIDWSAAHGIGVVQVLPINETGSDNSPYNAISASALEPLLIHVAPKAVPALPKKEFARALKEVGNGTSPVDYEKARDLKFGLLKAAWKAFRKKKHRLLPEFEAFCDTEKEWLEPYGLFRLLMERHGSEYWRSWEADQQTYHSALGWLEALDKGERKKALRRLDFFRFLQWIAYRQWREVKDYAEEQDVALMGDVPMGINCYSADVFAAPDEFDLEWSGGAPPEPYFKDDKFTQVWGQNWGIPLYRWDRMRENNFAWWRRRVRLVRDIFHLFRIDHVLGFYRIYAFPWRPEQNPEFVDLTPEEAMERTGGKLPGFVPRDDESPEHAEANRREGEDLLRVLIEEAGEYRLIGEDLGMVPPYVRPSLASLGIAGFKIPMWEGGPDDGGLKGEDYEALSVATYGTHDHEPIRVLWERWGELLHREEAGEPGAADGIRKDLHQLSVFTGFTAEDVMAGFTAEVHRRLLLALMNCRSWLAICMVTDLFGLKQRFNVPGAVATSNWSERLPHPVVEWPELELFAPLMRELRAMIKTAGRR